MDILEIKRALLEIKKICGNNHHCSTCPISKQSKYGFAFCPLHEDGKGLEIYSPRCWDIDEKYITINDTLLIVEE